MMSDNHAKQNLYSIDGKDGSGLFIEREWR